MARLYEKWSAGRIGLSHRVSQHLLDHFDARITSALLRSNLQLLINLLQAGLLSMGFVGGVMVAGAFIVRMP
ncbi:MAG: hypothetical protein DI584_04460 [Stenotrophomonas sp.]|nr:MAG: hypothetical protein DI584_04460 [Stenotrophomonas sp.]